MKGEFFYLNQNELFAFSIYFNVYNMYFLNVSPISPAIVKFVKQKTGISEL